MNQQQRHSLLVTIIERIRIWVNRVGPGVAPITKADGRLIIENWDEQQESILHRPKYQ